MCVGRTLLSREMSDTFLAAASQRALDLSLPSAPLACRGDSLALLDAQPGDSDSVFFVWLAPYLTATEVLPLLSVARAWRDAGESSRLWNAWAPFSSRQQCVELLRERERIRCNLVRYYCLLVQHHRGELAHQEELRDARPVFVEWARGNLEASESALRGLLALIPSGGTSGEQQLADCFRRAIESECTSSVSRWAGLHNAPLPAGLSSFFHIAAEVGMLSASADGISFDGHGRLGELSLLEPHRAAQPRLLLNDAGALLLLGTNAYDDDQDWLCVEWKAGTEPGSFTFSRFVTFHCWDDDSLASIGYAFSDPEPEWERAAEERPDLIAAGLRERLVRMEAVRHAEGGRGAPASLKAGEAVMASSSHCIRHAVFPSFEAVLAGLVDELRARRDQALGGRWGEWECFTCPGYGNWRNWHPVEVSESEYRGS